MMNGAIRPDRRVARALAGSAAVCTALALAGCGGAAPASSGTTVTHAARPTPAHSNPDIGDEGSQVNPSRAPAPGSRKVNTVGRHAQVSRIRAGRRVQSARPTPSSSNDDVSATGAKPINPCSLVSTAEAKTITGGAITQRVEAPLGPTCIYRGTGAKANITLAVELQSFSQITRTMRGGRAVTLNSRRAYCGRLGAQMLFVRLPAGQVLNVTAPCTIARRFAAVALEHLRT
jgi:hypothetical protein